MTTSVVLASLVATSLAGPGVSGLPATVNTVAGALAAYAIAVVMSRRGRKIGLLAGYAVGTIGAVVGCVFALAGSLLGFLLGNALMGLGQAASLHGRYAAADLVPPKVRGRVVGLLLFGSVIGAVVTALLARPLEFVAKSIDKPAASLGWGEAAIFLALGGLVMFLFFDASAGAPAQGSRPLSRADFLAAVTRPAVGLGVLNLVVGQSVMVMTMNLFPVHALQHGLTLADISTIVTIHVAGMFGLAWFIGGVVDRVGPILASAAGCLVLAAGAFTSSQSSEFAGLDAGLYLIGVGWNLCFVSGSALLATNLEPEIRVRFQGMADVLVWLSAGSAVLSG